MHVCFRCPECSSCYRVTPDTEGAPFACLDCFWRGFFLFPEPSWT